MPDIDNTSQYWVERKGQTMGPFTLEQMHAAVTGHERGTSFRDLGRILITDLAKNIEMKDWKRVDHLLASLPLDNTTDYWVRRNDQLSGPYTIELLRSWLTNGSRRIVITDQAKNIAMPEWLTVDQILRGS